MHPNSMHFRQKISFKSALEICTPISGHSKTSVPSGGAALVITFTDILINCFSYEAFSLAFILMPCYVIQLLLKLFFTSKYCATVYAKKVV